MRRTKHGENFGSLGDFHTQIFALMSANHIRASSLSEKLVESESGENDGVSTTLILRKHAILFVELRFFHWLSWISPDQVKGKRHLIGLIEPQRFFVDGPSD